MRHSKNARNLLNLEDAPWRHAYFLGAALCEAWLERAFCETATSERAWHQSALAQKQSGHACVAGAVANAVAG